MDDNNVYSDLLSSLGTEQQTVPIIDNNQQSLLTSGNDKKLDYPEDDRVQEITETIGELPKQHDIPFDLDKQLEKATNLTQSTEVYRELGKIVVSRADLEEALKTNANTFVIEEKHIEERPYPDIYYEYKDKHISSSTMVANTFTSIVNDIVRETIEEHGVDYLTPMNGFVKLPLKDIVNTFIEEFKLTVIKLESAFYVDDTGNKVIYQRNEKDKHYVTPESIQFDALDYYMKTDYSKVYLVDKSFIVKRTDSVMPIGKNHNTLKQYYIESKGNEYGEFKPRFYTDLKELLRVPYRVSIPKFILNEPFEDNEVAVPETIINGLVVDDSKIGVPVSITLEKILIYVSDGANVHFLNPKDVMPLLADIEFALTKLKGQSSQRKLFPELFYLEEEANEFMEDMLEKYILPYLKAIGKVDDVEKLYDQIAPTQPNPYLNKVDKQLKESSDLFYGVRQVDPATLEENDKTYAGTRYNESATTVLDNGIDLDYTSDIYRDNQTDTYGTVNEIPDDVLGETTFHTRTKGRDMSDTYQLMGIIT